MKAIQTKLLTADNIEKLHCYLCAGSGHGVWRLVGYDEYGELWICSACWEVHQSDEDPPQENGIETHNKS